VARLAADHNFAARIVAGLLRQKPNLDIVLLRDAGLATAPDPVVLEWAAREGLALLTHDRATLVGFAYDRVVRGEPMSGVIAVSPKTRSAALSTSCCYFWNVRPTTNGMDACTLFRSEALLRPPPTLALAILRRG
jgi:predicted nuclease of predicted toxin-antitoxin system